MFFPSSSYLLQWVGNKNEGTALPLSETKKQKNMAKLEQGILGAFSGRVGTVVGYSWRGRACVRAYKRTVAYPNTPMQQAERDWFVSMVRFASTARQALLLGLREQAERHQMTEGNYFVMSNKRCFARTHAPISAHGNATPSGIEGERRHTHTIPTTKLGRVDMHFNSSPKLGEVPEGRRSVSQGREACLAIDFEHIIIAEGTAAEVRFKAPQFEEGEVVRVEYEKNSMLSRASSEDSVYLFAYAPALGESQLSAPALRRSKVVKMRLPQHWSGTEVHLYGFVVDREGRASRSAYIGHGTVSQPDNYVPLVQVTHEPSDPMGFGINSNNSVVNHAAPYPTLAAEEREGMSPPDSHPPYCS